MTIEAVSTNDKKLQNDSNRLDAAIVWGYIPISENLPDDYPYTKCNKCGLYGNKTWDFCPNCKAKMSGDDE